MKYAILLSLVFFISITNATSLTVSGISSGGFMASQFGTIYSDQVNGVGTVAGGVFYCARNHFQEKIEKYGSQSYFAFGVASKSIFIKVVEPLEINPVYQAMGICMENPERAHAPDGGAMNLDFVGEFAQQGLIAATKNIAKQKVFIYQGENDDVLRAPMAKKLEEFYQRMGTPSAFMKTELRPGSHNFPTDREDGIACSEEKVPYIANCKYDLAGDILIHLTGRQLERTKFVDENLHLVAQKETPSSIHSYGYLYANSYCLNNPRKCDLHVAFHGCKMSDDYDENFQKIYESKVKLGRVLSVQDYELKARKSQMGAKIFAQTSGYGEYAESDKNRLMIYFPQTRITTENYPANPKGCWDWYGWTGSEYATNKGVEAQWLIKQIQIIRQNPQSLITEQKNTPILE